ncbi:hypothetical protein KFE25_001598 [Diacronema lutheri]|uniref:GST C-terminal domain-containing protein n=2 Tax=Diacronema lutheri TaxID=2081491 RepID=A0A8J5XGZ4_DIALT|nr:hypothetical protein KFE25_001598 [Diacronema lutheri]
MLLTLARWLSPNFFALAASSGQPILITIPYSHYNELARWALQLVGARFVEFGYSPLQHVLPVLAARLCGRKEHLSSSSKIERPPAAGDASDRALLHAPRGAPTAVPLLVLPDGRVLPDSWAIGAASGLAPITDPSLMHTYDAVLGPLTRQWIYFYLLKPAAAPLWDALITRDRHWIWRALYALGLRGAIRKRLTAAFRSDEPSAMATCRARLRAVIDELGASRVRARPGAFLNGDAISLEDVALAALVAPLVLPPNYCEGKYAYVLDAIAPADRQFAAELAEWRATAVGEYVLWLYAHHRLGGTAALPAGQLPAPKL